MRNFTDAADHIRAELPAFARWLRDYEIPLRCRGDVRFGVRCYHHASLIETARQSGNTAGFIELLERFLRSWFSSPCQLDWSGSATDLLAEMMADESTKHVAAKYTPDAIGRRLGQLKGQGYQTWVDSMSLDERREAEKMGLLKPYLQRHGNGAPDHDMADSPLASHTPDIAALVDHEDDQKNPQTRDVADVLRHFVADLLSEGTTSKPTPSPSPAPSTATATRSMMPSPPSTASATPVALPTSGASSPTSARHPPKSRFQFSTSSSASIKSKPRPAGPRPRPPAAS